MNVSLTPELERLVNEKVDSGLYQTASEVVREAFRLLKERDHQREQLRADVRAGFDQFARGEGIVYDKTSGRQCDQIARSRDSHQQGVMLYRLSALAERDLVNIWSYVAEDASYATADRLIDAIFEAGASAGPEARPQDRGRYNPATKTLDTFMSLSAGTMIGRR